MRGRGVFLADLASKRYESKRRATHPVGLCSLIVAGFLVLLSACAPSEEKSPITYRLPWLDASGTYTFQDIELSTFHEPDALRGGVAQIVVDPRLLTTDIDAQEPIARWSRQGSRMVPGDFVTQQAATLYAHLEKLAAVDKATGVDVKMKGVSRVGLLVRMSEKVSAPMILNNAVYDGRLDALFIVPYSGDLLPISENAGIIAHEHFHRVFQSIILTPIRESTRNGCQFGIVEDADDGDQESAPGGSSGTLVQPKAMNQALLRGMNEGFADFWGWAYSRDDEFVARSLGSREAAARRIDTPVASLPSKTGFRNSLITVTKTGNLKMKSKGGLVAASYRVGTEYARILRGVVEALVVTGGIPRDVAIEKTRLAMARSLDDTAVDVLGKFGREELDPELLLKPFFSKLIKMSATGPAILEASSANVVCDELARLGASSTMNEGLCGAQPAALSSESAAPSAAIVPTKPPARRK
jgi:hypothetical protein